MCSTVRAGSPDERTISADRSQATGAVSGREKKRSKPPVRRTLAFELRGSTQRRARSLFLRTIARLAREREQLRVVADQFGAPTSARSIAEMVAIMLAPSASVAELASRFVAARGLVHLANSRSTIWHGFACVIIEGLKVRGEEIKARVVHELLPIPAVASEARDLAGANRTNLTEANLRYQPARCTPPAAERPRSSSITSISDQPSAISRSRTAYCSTLLSRLCNT
jgi:hypothetical protein